MLYFNCKIMITNFLILFKKSPLLAFIKLEPTFLTGSLAVCLSAPVAAFTQEFRSGRQGEGGGRRVWESVTGFCLLTKPATPPRSPSLAPAFDSQPYSQ